MTKKKKLADGIGIGSESLGDESVLTQTHIPTPVLKLSASIKRSKPPEPSTSALIICRNKHWKYISSYHGPWLQLPPEVLDSLAYSNYTSPRPRPIDPAVFFDLVKVRRLVEDATDLAVRASNGTTSSSLSNSLNGGNNMPGGGGAAALGLGIGGGGANTKLSRERKHRMREHATQKLSHAYYLDEIAASVATMQSASSLEDVAKLVLQRSANDSDAKYVHFFHEKIPSRMLAQCTILKPLDEVIQDRPIEGAPLRTRAVTRIFKNDFVGAAQDLTEALAICRHSMAQHRSGRGQLELANTLGTAERRNGGARDWNGKLDEEDHPSSLEPQLLFHRAGVYLTLACQRVHAALDGVEQVVEMTQESLPSATSAEPVESFAMRESHKRRLEARKIVKSHAKRALRDYVSFLSGFEYTPGLPAAISEDSVHRVSGTADGSTKVRNHQTNRLLEISGNPSLSNGTLSDALTPYKHSDSQGHSGIAFHNGHTYRSILPPEIHPVSSLFSPSPPANLPPYPCESQALIPRELIPQHNDLDNPLLAHSDQHESVTYHPLLTDALHSLLLCHALIQTSPKEHLRHANNVARLARVCDGYPIFLAARSPSRADWIEVVRRTHNWIGLQQSWETLCAPAPLPGHASAPGKNEETEEEAKERRKQEAIMEALADERVHDEASFQAAVAARECQAEEQRREESGQGGGGAPKRWAQEDGKEYPISTERAEAVARWVTEAPLTVEGAGKAKRGAKRGKEVVRSGGASAASSVVDLSKGMGQLDANGKEGHEDAEEKGVDEEYLSALIQNTGYSKVRQESF